MKKDGTFLEIRVRFKQNIESRNGLDISVENSYCDKNLTRFALYQMINITKAVNTATNTQYEESKHVDKLA